MKCEITIQVEISETMARLEPIPPEVLVTIVTNLMQQSILDDNDFLVNSAVTSTIFDPVE
jgi:hypothetical protein